jgi:hypothetical protein
VVEHWRGNPALSGAYEWTGEACADPKELGRSRCSERARRCTSGNSRQDGGGEKKDGLQLGEVDAEERFQVRSLR